MTGHTVSVATTARCLATIHQAHDIIIQYADNMLSMFLSFVGIVSEEEASTVLGLTRSVTVAQSSTTGETAPAGAATSTASLMLTRTFLLTW